MGTLVVSPVGSLEETGDPFLPYRLVGADGATIAAAAAYFAELAACGRPATTQRSYAMDLLRWFRFLAALGVTWNEAPRSPHAPTGDEVVLELDPVPLSGPASTTGGS